MGRMCVLALLIIIMLLFEKRANQKKVDRKRQKEFQVKLCFSACTQTIDCAKGNPSYSQSPKQRRKGREFVWLRSEVCRVFVVQILHAFQRVPSPIRYSLFHMNHNLCHKPLAISWNFEICCMKLFGLCGAFSASLCIIVQVVGVFL